MPRPIRTLALFSVLGLAGAAHAAITDSWPLLAFDTESSCELRIAGNGRFVEIGATGLIPGEALHLKLSNGDMKPLVLGGFANSRGEWSKLYVPFRFGAEGGTVAVEMTASRCTLSASVPWKREVRTIP